jgi:deoxyribose-phosphate aldolase
VQYQEVKSFLSVHICLIACVLIYSQEVKSMKEACGPKVHLKAILAIGELGSMTNVYKASLACMMAGADFIKTSTGKEGVNATLEVGLVIIDLIYRSNYFLYAVYPIRI